MRRIGSVRRETPAAVVVRRAPGVSEHGPATAMRFEGASAAAGGTSGEGRRILELDALRGLACVLVLAYHIRPSRLPGGWAAVDLFLVLSGYLISSIILAFGKERRFLFHFYMRRGLRLWPAYYLTVLLVAALVPFLPRRIDYAGLPYLLTYTQNVPRYWSAAAPEFTSYLSHTWSLAVEEQFYLLWPLILRGVGRRGTVFLALVLVGAGVWARARHYHWWLLLARCDGLALGAVLAVLLPPGTAARRRPVFLPLALGTLGLTALVYLVVLYAVGGMSAVGRPRWPALTILVINVLAFSVVGLVLCHEGHPVLRPLRSRWLVRLGVSSYGMYLYHYVVLLVFDDVAERLGMRGRPFWREALAVAVVVALAALSWRWLERPLLGLKARFPYAPCRHTVDTGCPGSAPAGGAGGLIAGEGPRGPAPYVFGRYRSRRQALRS